jgi:hypothetical protein
MMPLADLAQLTIAGKNRVAGRRRIVVGESIILAGDDGDGHGALQVLRAARLLRSCRVRRLCLGQSRDSRNAGAAAVHKFVIAHQKARKSPRAGRGSPFRCGRSCSTC